MQRSGCLRRWHLCVSISSQLDRLKRPRIETLRVSVGLRFHIKGRRLKISAPAGPVLNMGMTRCPTARSYRRRAVDDECLRRSTRSIGNWRNCTLLLNQEEGKVWGEDSKVLKVYRVRKTGDSKPGRSEILLGEEKFRHAVSRHKKPVGISRYTSVNAQDGLTMRGIDHLVLL